MTKLFIVHCIGYVMFFSYWLLDGSFTLGMVLVAGYLLAVLYAVIELVYDVFYSEL